MRDRTLDLWNDLDNLGYLPAAARAQIERSVGTQPVLAYYLSAVPFVGSGSGVATQVRAAIVTDTRFVHCLWFEDTNEPDDEQDNDPLSIELDQLLAQTAAPARHPQPAILTTSARTVSLRQIVDVQTSVAHLPNPLGGAHLPSHASVLVLSPTLSSLTLMPAACGDQQCHAIHPTEGRAMQDAIELSADLELDGPAAVHNLLNFAAVLETHLP